MEEGAEQERAPGCRGAWRQVPGGLPRSQWLLLWVWVRGSSFKGVTCDPEAESADRRRERTAAGEAASQARPAVPALAGSPRSAVRSVPGWLARSREPARHVKKCNSAPTSDYTPSAVTVVRSRDRPLPRPRLELPFSRGGRQ